MIENLTDKERLDTVMTMLAEISRDFRCEIVAVVSVPVQTPDGDSHMDAATGVFGSTTSDVRAAGEACVSAAEMLRIDGERLMREDNIENLHVLTMPANAEALKS